MKFLIEVDIAGCEGIDRSTVADALAVVIDDSAIHCAISDGLLDSLSDLSRLAKPQYEDGRCPDCGEPIPDNTTFRDTCVNCGHAFLWGHDENDEPEGPGLRSLSLANDALRVAVDHLTIYVDPEQGNRCYMVDKDHADDEYGKRCPGSSGIRFSDPKDAGIYVAQWLADINKDLPLQT